jgi:hypothetical protein
MEYVSERDYRTGFSFKTVLDKNIAHDPLEVLQNFGHLFEFFGHLVSRNDIDEAHLPVYFFPHFSSSGNCYCPANSTS